MGSPGGGSTIMFPELQVWNSRQESLFYINTSVWYLLLRKNRTGPSLYVPFAPCSIHNSPCMYSLRQIIIPTPPALLSSVRPNLKLYNNHSNVVSPNLSAVSCSCKLSR